jgi:hypothetical protein
LADKLLSLDEASLLCLWDKYYALVQKFEPTKRWEQAVLILSMIQGVRWKNQLFNVKWLHLTRLEKRFNRKFPVEIKEKGEIAPSVIKELDAHHRKKEKGKVIFLESIKKDKDKRD